MPSYSEEKRKYHTERVRSVLVVRPNATPSEIKQVLEESHDAPMKLDRLYITKLMKKIVGERASRLERGSINIRLSSIRDKKDLVDTHLWREATAQDNPGVVRVMALKELVKNELELLQSEMDAGVFKRHLGNLEIEKRFAPLPPEQITGIIQALLAWGTQPPQVREVHANEIKREDTKPNNSEGTADGLVLVEGR